MNRRGVNPFLVTELLSGSLPIDPQNGRTVVFDSADDDSALNVSWWLRYHPDSPATEKWDSVAAPIAGYNPNTAPLNVPYNSWQLIDDIGFMHAAPFVGEYTLNYSIDIQNPDVIPHDFVTGIMDDYSGAPGDVSWVSRTVGAGKKETFSGVASFTVSDGHAGCRFGPAVLSLDDVTANVGNYRWQLFLLRAQYP